jgi:plasmid replication initiation protein
MSETVPKDIMLYQSNALTEGRYQFDLIEKRIVYFIINEVRKKFVEKEDGQRDIFNDLVIQLPGEQLRRADSNMKRVYESAKRLRHKDIEINNADEWLTVGFINYAKHDKKSDIMEMGISSQILPHIVQLTQKFTSYHLAVSITLKSTYTQRFYELCSQWKNKGYFYMKVDNLRRMLKCEDKFKTFGEFKRGVIKTAQKELKELYDQGMCDLHFDYGILEKDKKRVVTLEFYVRTQENTNKTVYSISDYQFFIRNIMQASFPKDKAFVERVMTACKDFETAEKISEKLSKKKNEYTPREFPLIVRYVLREDFQIS